MAENAIISNELQLVVFDLASEYYGVDINDVREIIRMQSITRVPGAVDYIEGVLNLRGKIAPVVDLRKRLNLKVSGLTKESRDVGIIVDGVTEVLRIPLSSVEPPAQILQRGDNVHLKGIAKLQDKLVILLDMENILKELDNIDMNLIRHEIENNGKSGTKPEKYITV